MYQLEGKVYKVCDQVTGVSQTTGNPWSSQMFVISYMQGDREKYAAFSVFNKTLNIKEGDSVIVDFTPSARENQTTGKWYTSLYVDALSIMGTVDGMSNGNAPQAQRQGFQPQQVRPVQQVQQPVQQPAPQPQQPQYTQQSSSSDNLPF